MGTTLRVLPVSPPAAVALLTLCCRRSSPSHPSPTFPGNATGAPSQKTTWIPSSCHPRISDAGFARFEPNAYLTPHTNNINVMLKMHCTVANPDNLELSFATGDRIRWKPGECYLLDSTYEHWVLSQPWQRPRLILEIAFSHPDLEYFRVVVGAVYDSGPPESTRKKPTRAHTKSHEKTASMLSPCPCE